MYELKQNKTEEEVKTKTELNDHIFNYHIPYSAEGYTHRIGRTGRAGRKGTAISLLAPSEFRQLCRMFKLNKDKIDIRTIPTLSELKEKQREDLLEKISTPPLAGSLSQDLAKFFWVSPILINQAFRELFNDSKTFF